MIFLDITRENLLDKKIDIILENITKDELERIKEEIKNNAREIEKSIFSVAEEAIDE